MTSASESTRSNSAGKSSAEALHRLKRDVAMISVRMLRGLTFDMRGGRQLAKPDVARPLDGRVRLLVERHAYLRASRTDATRSETPSAPTTAPASRANRPRCAA